MLFEIKENKLTPVPFLSMADVSKLEKDLENLLSVNMFETLFEDNPYMVIFQERAFQPEPDIISLNRDGDLVIFELKRQNASADALSQLFRYAQVTQKFNYETLQEKFLSFRHENTNVSLKQAHQEAFNLDSPLSENQFNKQQHMIVVGSSADDELVDAIKYWISKGISIDFIPYRLYKMGESLHFEFFAKPFDFHSNPNDVKGVIFDTNRTWDEKALAHMIQKNRVSAFGDRTDAIYCLRKNDIVFLSHRYIGIVAAAKVKSNHKTDSYYEQGDELYVDVEWLTPIPTKFETNIPHISFGCVSEITEKSFFWARIDKRPFLTEKESEKLLNKMNEEFK